MSILDFENEKTNVEDKNFSRRNFLRLTFSLAVGTLLVPMDSAEAKKKKIIEKDSDKIVQPKTEIISMPSIGGKTESLQLIEPNLRFRRQPELRRKTDQIIIHHVGGTDREVSAATIHQWHLQNGWVGIGYHFVIHKDGRVERGRPLNTVGAHCQGQNDHTIGINLTGNFDYSRPTDAQLAAAEILLSNICMIYKLDPGSRAIFGHRDFNNTRCPGANAYVELPTIIEQTQNRFKVIEEISRQARTEQKNTYPEDPRSNA